MKKILLSGVIVALLSESHGEARADIPFGTHRIFHGVHQTFKPGSVHPHGVCSIRYGKRATLGLDSVSEGETLTMENGAVVQYRRGYWWALSHHTRTLPCK